MTGAPDPAGRLLSDADFLRHGALPKLLAALNDDAEEARIVGGAVRNALIGQPVTDVDVATTAVPQTVIDRAAAAGFRSVPTGIEHGTVTVLVDGERFEVTTLRADVETDGRHAKVRFGRSFAEDALRRDFSINALFATQDGRVFDHVGGLADLASRRVRFIGDPVVRIREDYLRILRFFRFHAIYGEGPPDAAGLRAAVGERRGLALLSRERVSAELLKLVVARGAAEVIAVMSDAGILGPLIGGVAYPLRLGRVAAIERFRQTSPDALLRLAALAVAIVEDADRLRTGLRLSNDNFERLAAASRVHASLHGRERSPDSAELTKLLFLRGPRAARDGLTLAHAASLAAVDDADWRSAWRLASEMPPPALPFTGADVLARGIASGPTVGEILKTLQARWIRAGFPKDPAALARLLDAAIDTVGRSSS